MKRHGSPSEKLGGGSGSVEEEKAKLRVFARQLQKEREELEAFKASALLASHAESNAVANVASAAMALETGNLARIRWHVATNRIINLMGQRKSQSLVDKMKKNMNSSMLASLATMPPAMEASASRQSRFFEEGDGRTITDKCFWGIPYLKKILGDKKSLEREVFGRVDPVNTLDDFFFYTELGFGLAFTFEICLKFVGFGLLGFWTLGRAGTRSGRPSRWTFSADRRTIECLRSEAPAHRRILAWNWMDLFVVLTWLVDVLGAAVEINPMMFRVLRMAKLGRIVRVLKVIQQFDSLHLLLGSIRASFDILAWFTRALADPRLKVWLAALDLQSSDAENLFNLLDDGDGSISYQEFLSGAKRLKGGAQSIDLVTLMRECGNMHHDIRMLSMTVEKMAAKMKLMSANPWPVEDWRLGLEYADQLKDFGLLSAKGLGFLLARAEGSEEDLALDLLWRLARPLGPAAVSACAQHAAVQGEAAKAADLVAPLASRQPRGLARRIWVACGGTVFHPNPALGEKGVQVAVQARSARTLRSLVGLDAADRLKLLIRPCI
eukprot:g31982.t1